MGCSLQSLDEFPAFLNFDLDKRIKPRYRFHMWLTENNLCRKEYALTSIISSSEKRFIALIYRMHPAAPKKWLASFYKNPGVNDTCLTLIHVALTFTGQSMGTMMAKLVVAIAWWRGSARCSVLVSIRGVMFRGDKKD
ncbi:hypothetical protein POM88_000366 [Heracleum sosnowskyi]|uniref:Uncharacterized protein n=1 Tax=Heracleum sosnowskyi TaxID=360622 RepID=A0AAD8JBP4_9APIA|nr:hypothetical protein POM88_000366 [Heracleum sosnowskyi]